MVLLKTDTHWVKKKAEIFEAVEGNNASEKRKRMKNKRQTTLYLKLPKVIALSLLKPTIEKMRQLIKIINL